MCALSKYFWRADNRWELMLLSFFILTISMADHSGRSAEAEESTPIEVSFNHDVRPILSSNCFLCHGLDEQRREADLRLDLPDDVDFEEVIARITTDDPDLIMPPPSTGKSLSATQIETLKRWVQAGATYQQHWSLKPVEAPRVPDRKPDSSIENPIDQFVLAKLAREGIQPTGEADKRTLIRRLSMDLTGLPPTREQIAAFLADESPKAYDRLVDQTLASKHFGEHMARYWLDLVRFADTNGLHHDHYREMTPYRDWVIRAFNENLRFDEFITAQLAGDLFADPTNDQLIASGFNRLHLIIDRGTALPEESFTRNVVDRVSAVGTAFLGLTLECAVCHDHKYDPVTMRDFYQLYAFFNNFDGEPETGSRKGLDFKRGLQPPYLELPSDEQKQRVEQLKATIADLEKQIRQTDEKLKETGGEDAESKSARDRLAVELDTAQKQLESVVLSIPATLVMKEREQIRPAHMLVRGNYDQLGEVVQRNTPACLPPLEPEGEVPSRMDLARWMVKPNHPLTSRVAVNRFWQQVFGVGLVKTSEDFGAQGEPPSHPKLLDYLASQFIRSQWDVKSLLRVIVLSETYRRTAVAPRSMYVADPENRLLARGSRYRYDGEVIRDQVLFSTGLLNPVLFGKSVKPPQPAGLWEIVAMPYSYPRSYVPDQGDQIYRRSVYTFWKRALPPPQLTIFDAPSRESCIARRERTNTPLQALVLMNEQQFYQAAMNLAHQLMTDDSVAVTQRIDVVYERITSHLPSPSTKETLRTALRQFNQLYVADQESLEQLIENNPRIEGVASWGRDKQAEFAALTMLVHSILNLDATKTRE